MKNKQGAIIYDAENDQMDIRFDLDDYYGGLHCGMTMDVFAGGHWISTRIEKGESWYLVGIKTRSIEGLRVKI